MTDTARTQDRLRDKTTETRESLADAGRIAKEAVQDKYHDLKERASEMYDDGKEKLDELEANLARNVRAAPMKSLLIAAGVGLVLGFLWRRS